MSNLSELLKDIGAKNSQVVTLVGDTIGTIADVSGAAGAVIGLIDLIVGQSDQTQQELQNLLTAIQEDLQQLIEDQKVRDILNRCTNIANQSVRRKRYWTL